MLDRLARAISILGHPLLTLPAALALPAALREGDPVILRSMLVGFALFAALVISGSWWQVHRGRWAHIDASEPSERHALNRTLLVAIAIGALLAWLRLPTQDLAVALALSACIVAVAMVCAQWCKLSLHVAFVVYAAGLLWPLSAIAVGAGLVFGVIVAWSRLRLSRHRPRDIIAGTFAGGMAAIIDWTALHSLQTAS